MSSTKLASSSLGSAPPPIFGGTRKLPMMRYGSAASSSATSCETNSSSSSSSSSLMTTSTATTTTKWTPTQLCYRKLLISIREAYYYDRAKLFWTRHRLKVEMYKYRSVTDEEELKALVGIGNEIAKFVELHMKFSVQRVVDHNNAIQKMPVDEAKKFRQRYLEREEQHEIWCKSRIKMMMRRRPPPPYPFC